MHTIPLIQDLAVILATAGLVTFLFRKIRQPVVLGYIVAGILVGPHTPPHAFVQDLPNIQTWSELGVIFLMFALGLEFTFHKLTRVGVAATVTAVVEVVAMLGLGFLAGRILGWNFMDSVFLGGILSISSTTIILKAFDELGLKSRKFAQTVFGILIVEDLVAILLLVALSTVAVSQTFFSWELLVAAVKLVLVVGSWIVIGYFVIPSFFRYAGRQLEDETLTLIACGLCLGLVAIATQFHYSAALGAFIMGSILAETREVGRIEHLIQPLKNIFAAVFFVSVGMLVDPKVILENAGAVALISVVTIFGKLASSTLGAFVSGQNVRSSVRIGFSLAQIGEFSFIIAALGTSLGVTSGTLYPIAVAVSVLTTFSTPYLIRLSGPAANWVEKRLPSRLRSLEDVEHSLAPWDLHLVPIEVSPDSTVVGKTLEQLEVRTRYQVNVVLIKRGTRNIVGPRAQDLLLPSDSILVLGDDEQIDVFRKRIEDDRHDSKHDTPVSEYRLQRLVIDEASGLMGKTIRAAEIPIVVGMERGSQRWLNPSPDLPLEAKDVLWTVGEAG